MRDSQNIMHYATALAFGFFRCKTEKDCPNDYYQSPNAVFLQSLYPKFPALGVLIPKVVISKQISLEPISSIAWRALSIDMLPSLSCACFSILYARPFCGA